MNSTSNPAISSKIQPKSAVDAANQATLKNGAPKSPKPTISDANSALALTKPINVNKWCAITATVPAIEPASVMPLSRFTATDVVKGDIREPLVAPSCLGILTEIRKRQEG